MMSVSLQPTPPPAVMHTFVHSRHIVLESRSNRIQTGTMRPFVRSCSFVRSFVRSATNNKDRLVTHRRQPAAPHSFPPTHSFSVAGKSTLLTGLPTPGRSLSVAVIIKVRQTRTITALAMLRYYTAMLRCLLLVLCVQLSQMNRVASIVGTRCVWFWYTNTALSWKDDDLTPRMTDNGCPSCGWKKATKHCSNAVLTDAVLVRCMYIIIK